MQEMRQIEIQSKYPTVTEVQKPKWRMIGRKCHKARAPSAEMSFVFGFSALYFVFLTLTSHRCELESIFHPYSSQSLLLGSQLTYLCNVHGSARPCGLD